MLCFLIVITQFGFSQNETNIWYFGQNAGLDFNSGSPVALLDGQLSTSEGCATIADSSGSLLFYTDGITVWNKNHAIMSNGTGLMGNPSTTQAATIVPLPGSSSLYYIFTLDAYGWENGFRYSIVDMTLDSGNGAIIDKNILIYTPSCEKLAIVKHANNIDFWIVTHGWGNASFYSYLLTSSGLSSSSVESNIGINVITTNSDNSIGYMKISPNGSKLALCHYFSSSIQVFDFNQNTGYLSNEVTIYNGETESRLYGLEFSSNSNVLYFTKEFITTTVYQCNLNSVNIPSTVNAVYNDSSPFAMALQLGPDNKIYIGQLGSTKLGVINQPNLLGNSCDLQMNFIDLTGRYCLRGLPPFVTSFFDVGILTTNVCDGSSASFTLNTPLTLTSVLWNFGDGDISTETNPTHIYASAGTYTVTVTAIGSAGTATNSRNITIYPKPTLLANTVSLKQCDDNNDGYSAFNLNQIIPSIVANTTGLTITFHEELQHAQDDTAAIANTTAYTNALVSNDVVYARIENENGCYKTAQINLHVSTTSIPSSFQITKTVCDDLASGTNADGIATFDFSDATAQVQALYPAGQQLIINYYKNLADALAETNAITNTANYSNVGYPNTQNIYVRVDSQVNNECLGLGHHITLKVERIPIVQPMTIKHCDDNHDGIFGFDTTNLQTTLLNGLTDVVVSYTDQSGNTLLSPLPNPFTTTSQTITARVKNNYGTPCDYTTTIQFVVDDLPVANTISTNLTTFCSNQSSVSVDTSTFQSTIVGSQTGMIVNYFDANNNALTSPLLNPFVTPQQTITAEVINTANTVCKVPVSIPFVIHALPKINLVGDELICSDNPNFTKIIDAGLLDVTTQNQHTYTWYLNNSLLPNQTNYSLTVNTEGIYKVEVKNSNGCVASRIITVTSSNQAIVDSLIVTDLVEENSIEVVLSNASHGNYVYSLDGVYFQTSATFSNILPGIYTVYIKDLKGCGTLPKQVSVLGIPKYFTPNGDGFNDHWNMIGVNQKFNAKSTVFIYDRFGKLLFQTTPLSTGWDGTYNGQPMISSDYWYSISLEDGRVMKGHFSLKR